jgi:hypothetical protein
LLSNIPNPRNDQDPDDWWNSNISMTPQQAVDAFDHIFENWALPATDKKGFWAKDDRTSEQKVEIFDCGQMLSMNAKEIEEKLASLPPYFSESMFPVAVARFMLRELQMPINHRKTKHFHEFHVRYGAMVLASLRP